MADRSAVRDDGDLSLDYDDDDEGGLGLCEDKSLGGRDKLEVDRVGGQDNSVSVSAISLGRREHGHDGSEVADTLKILMNEFKEMRREMNEMKTKDRSSSTVSSDRKRKSNESWSKEEVKALAAKKNRSESETGQDFDRQTRDFGLSFAEERDECRPRSGFSEISNPKRGDRLKIDQTQKRVAKPSPVPDNDDALSLHPDDEELELFLCEDEAEEEDDILVEIEKEIEEEKRKGPDINSKLANVVSSRFTSRLNEEAMKGKLEQYKLPQNCEAIAPPTLNQELLQTHVGLKRNARRDDARLVAVQRMISKATTAIARATDKLHNFSASCGKQVEVSEMKKLANQVMGASLDAIAFLGNAQMDLSLRRKYQMIKDLPPDIRSICHQKIDRADSDKLFGDDVTKLMKEAREAHRLSQRRGGGQQHYQRKPFLFGRGRGSYSSYTTAPTNRFTYNYNKKRGAQSGRK